LDGDQLEGYIKIALATDLKEAGVVVPDEAESPEDIKIG
jgi:hypothetical protein